jgi:UDP-N-acetylglucosamine:LPS N-acetylglucosamine transferase
MAAAGAAVLLHDMIEPDANADQLALLLDEYAANPQQLVQMRRAFQAIRQPSGAADLARRALALLQRGR